SGLYTIPSSASFAAGSATANITIDYDPTKIEYDDYTDITIAVQDASSMTPYGGSSYTFSVGIPAPWTSLGTNGHYTDNWQGWDYAVEVQQNDLDPTLYRIVRPFDKGLATVAAGNKKEGEQSTYWEFRVMPVGTTWRDVTTTVDGLVAYGTIVPGYYNTSYSQLEWYLHPSSFTNYATEDFWLHNIVTTWTEDGEPAVVQFAPYVYLDGIGGWNYTQEDGFITLVMPGVVLKDYSASIEYKGRFTDPANANYAVIAATIGADVASAKIAIVPGRDPNVGVNGILDGSLEAIEVTANGEVQVPCEIDGPATAVIVTYDGDVAQEAAYINFNFSTGGSANPMDKLEKGKSIDDYVGQWKVPSTDGDQSGYFVATITKADDTTLFVNGLCPITGYDDTMALLYDPETGLLTLMPQLTSILQGYQGILVVYDSTEGYFYDESSENFIGGLTKDGELLFVENPDNEYFWDSFMYLITDGNGNYGDTTGFWHYLNWTANTASASTRSFSIPTVKFSGKAVKMFNPTSAPSQPVGKLLNNKGDRTLNIDKATRFK
ncbi:MAG: hypothetical protein LBL97_05030, partial [Prevotellaceae bacterium]|nr:hypothetical protein [Prevotellaceae bacterium]